MKSDSAQRVLVMRGDPHRLTHPLRNLFLASVLKTCPQLGEGSSPKQRGSLCLWRPGPHSPTCPACPPLILGDAALGLEHC